MIIMLPIISYNMYNAALAVSMPFAFLDPFTGSTNESEGDSANNSNSETEICFDNKDNNGNGKVDETCSSESIMEVLKDMIPCTPGLDKNCGLPNTTGSVSGDTVQTGSKNSPEPEPEICNDKEDNNGNGKVDENCASVSDTNQDDKKNSQKDDNTNDKVDGSANGKTKSDKFGIREIYPTKTDG